MRREGVEYTCSRCGKVEFITWNPIYNKYPDEETIKWLAIDNDIHLCPICAKRYYEMMQYFLQTKEVSPL